MTPTKYCRTVQLPDGWTVEQPDPADRFDVARLTHLLRAHERHGRGWAGASVDDVLVEVSEHGLRMRENVVLRDAERRDPGLGQRPRPRRRAGCCSSTSSSGTCPTTSPTAAPTCCSSGRPARRARSGAARGLDVQQIDTGAFADDERQHALAGAVPASSGSAPGGR